MRIIGGEFGGRRIDAPTGAATRPSAARVREGLASALDARGLLRDARVIDLFAGSGALGFEALSRGAACLVAVDASARAVHGIEDNARTLGVAARVRVIRLDLLARPGAAATRLGRTGAAPFTLGFVDAPYARLGAVPALIARLAEGGVFAPGGVVAVEHTAKAALAWSAGLLSLATYRYGGTGVTLLEVARGGRT